MLWNHCSPLGVLSRTLYPITENYKGYACTPSQNAFTAFLRKIRVYPTQKPHVAALSNSSPFHHSKQSVQHWLGGSRQARETDKEPFNPFPHLACVCVCVCVCTSSCHTQHSSADCSHRSSSSGVYYVSKGSPERDRTQCTQTDTSLHSAKPSSLPIKFSSLLSNC